MRRPDVLRSIKLTIALKEDVWLKMTAHLYSSVEGRVPKGAYQAFLTDRINEFFTPKEQPNAGSTESGTAGEDQPVAAQVGIGHDQPGRDARGGEVAAGGPPSSSLGTGQVQSEGSSEERR